MRGRAFVGAAAMLAAGLCAPPASAMIVYMSLGHEYSGGTPPVGTIAATISDIAGGVKLELSNNLVAPQFVDEWYFNLDPGVTGANISQVGGAGVAPATWTVSYDGLKADGDGFFDLRFNFATGNNDPNRFTGSETATFQILNTNVQASDFLTALSVGAGNSQDGLYSAAHVQAIPPGGGSGWVTLEPNTTPIEIPLPAALWLLGAGFLGYLGIGYSRRTEGV